MRDRRLDTMQGVGEIVQFVRRRATLEAPRGRRSKGTTMTGDTLSDLLRAIRLRGAFFFYVEGADPWVVETSHSSELIDRIMPGVDHMMEFHGIASGSCWAAIVGEDAIRLNEGDVILFPHG